LLYGKEENIGEEEVQSRSHPRARGEKAHVTKSGQPASRENEAEN
jgi:hypothetical protein